MAGALSNLRMGVERRSSVMICRNERCFFDKNPKKRIKFAKNIAKNLKNRYKY